MNRHALNRRTFLKGAAAAAGATAVTTVPSAALGAAPILEPNLPHLSVCIEALFTQAPFEQRPALVRDCGLKALEFWGWRGRNLEALRRATDEAEVVVAAFACETGGPLVAPGSTDRFLPALKASLTAAKQLSCRRLLVTAGEEQPGLSRAAQHANVTQALKAAAPLLEDAGVTLCLEPLNVLVDHKGQYLSRSAEAFEMVAEVGSPRVRVLYDIYHQQITEGNLIQTITRNLKAIAHFHAADVPGRHQLGTGEIHYENLFRRLGDAGYTSFVGLEMWPTIDHATAIKQAMHLFYAGVMATRARSSGPEHG